MPTGAWHARIRAWSEPSWEGSRTRAAGGHPVVRVGDGGVHAGCCGPNWFEAIEGDPDVLIDGRPAVRKGDRTADGVCTGTVQTGHPGP